MKIYSKIYSRILEPFFLEFDDLKINKDFQLQWYLNMLFIVGSIPSNTSSQKNPRLLGNKALVYEAQKNITMIGYTPFSEFI